MVRKGGPQGLGWLMMKRLQKMYSLFLSVNTSAIGGPFVQKLGWSRFSRIPRHVFVLDQESSMPMLSPGSNEDDLQAFLLQSEVPFVPVNRQRALHEDNYHPDWSLYPHLSFGTVRSLEYLTW